MGRWTIEHDIAEVQMDRGVVLAYDGAKGFGFIRSRGYAQDVFVHASAIDGGGPLRVGQRVAFEAETAEKGPRASRVEPGQMGLSPSQVGASVLGLMLVGATVGMHAVGLGWLGAWLAGVNLATWPVYAWDKRRAGLGGRRVPEAVLLGLALAGGSPAAALAMGMLRHKTRKAPFLLGFGGVLLIQAILVGLALRGGRFSG